MRVEYLAAATGGYDAQLLGGLRYSYYEGPYNLGIAIGGDNIKATRARFENASVRSVDGGEAIHLDLRDEVRWTEQADISKDGWIPFQTWPTDHDNPDGSMSGRAYAVNVGSYIDLQPLGGDLVLSVTIVLDIDGKLTRHDVKIPLTRTHVTSSQIWAAD